MIDPEIMRVYGLSHPPYNPINDDTVYHADNRRFARNDLITRCAYVAALALIAAVGWRVWG